MLHSPKGSCRCDSREIATSEARRSVEIRPACAVWSSGSGLGALSGVYERAPNRLRGVNVATACPGYWNLPGSGAVDDPLDAFALDAPGLDQCPHGGPQHLQCRCGCRLRRPRPCAPAELPQPRSSRMPAADTRAAAGTASWLTIPASTLMHSSVCPRASDRKSAGNLFRGKWLTGWAYPLLLAQASRVRRGDNHANNLTQKARTLLTEDADLRFVQIWEENKVDVISVSSLLAEGGILTVLIRAALIRAAAPSPRP